MLSEMNTEAIGAAYAGGFERAIIGRTAALSPSARCCPTRVCTTRRCLCSACGQRQEWLRDNIAPTACFGNLKRAGETVWAAGEAPAVSQKSETLRWPDAEGCSGRPNLAFG